MIGIRSSQEKRQPPMCRLVVGSNLQRDIDDVDRALVVIRQYVALFTWLRSAVCNRRPPVPRVFAVFAPKVIAPDRILMDNSFTGGFQG